MSLNVPKRLSRFHLKKKKNLIIFKRIMKKVFRGRGQPGCPRGAMQAAGVRG